VIGVPGIGAGFGSSIWVGAIIDWDDGQGSAIYACGNFTVIGGIQVNGIARWRDGAWSALGTGLTAAPNAMAAYETGASAVLFVAGAGYNGLSRWNGSSWEFPMGIMTGPFPTQVAPLMSYDDGTGPALVAGGSFLQAAGTPSNGIARWRRPRPRLSLTQTLPGAGAIIHNSELLPGHSYRNIFSTEICGVLGSGPHLGLCATVLDPLILQFVQPLGTPPFHFLAPGPVADFGPYSLPIGFSADGVCFDTTNNVLGCVSAVVRLTIQ
jgi:hypothetical protein